VPTPARSPGRAGRLSGPLWTGAALGIATLVAVPILAVLTSLAAPVPEVWAHLLHTQLAELTVNTLVLLVAVGVGVLVLGTGLAWLVAAHRFPGHAFFEWALVLPLAIPAYVIGFVFLGLLDFAGPVQTTLRQLLGPDLRLPEPRSGAGVIVVMILVLYPYVYTLARAAFLEQGLDTVEAARSLGLPAHRVFLRVTLPMARPSIATGVSLALMEALADFGTVATFGYRTYTEAIYRVWHGMFDRLAATQLAVVLLGLAALLLALERSSRGRARYAQAGQHGRSPAPARLRGWPAALATTLCLAVFALAFALPVSQLCFWAGQAVAREGLPRGGGRELTSSIWLAGVTALVALGVALILAYAVRLRRSRLVALAARFSALGYALPGSVIAVGVLLPMGWLDRLLTTAAETGLGRETGLLLTGSAAGLVFAYLVRFLAVAFQTVEAALAKISSSLDDAARSLGSRSGRTLLRVHVPLMWRGLGAAVALVFVDVMKEMPATILLRPFGLDTLAIGVWQRTSESLWEAASIPALAIVLVGLLPVALTMRGLTGRAASRKPP
jgi:iron(III) transport system permease protein